MSIFLEVIVTSVAEAIAAEQGGADRLELVRDLEAGGLSPSPSVVKDVVSSVRIPVRVMVRESDSMSLSNSSELDGLRQFMGEISTYPVDGFVLGYLRNREIDRATLDQLLPAANKRVTFHRAFDEVRDPAEAIEVLKSYPQIDRILTRAGEGQWQARRQHLDYLRLLAAPQIQILFAIGRDTAQLGELRDSAELYEVHVGRAARIAHVNSGPVSARYVAALKDDYAESESARDQVS